MSEFNDRRFEPTQRFFFLVGMSNSDGTCDLHWEAMNAYATEQEAMSAAMSIFTEDGCEVAIFEAVPCKAIYRKAKIVNTRKP